MESPIILSLVYDRGAILASKRTPYDDLLTTDLDEQLLAERLQRQHKLICAAIRNGRIEDLKRMNERPPAPVEVAGDASATKGGVAVDVAVDNPLELDSGIGFTEAHSQIRTQEEPSATRSTVRVIKDGVADFARQFAADNAPNLDLLDEGQIRGGSEIELRVKVTQSVDENLRPLAAVAVKAKVLGTAFKQIDCVGQTNEQGIAAIILKIPAFTFGRAVLLITVVANGHEATLRRIVHPA